MFGLVLLGLGWASAGGGHGTYLPVMVFGAPLSVVPVLGLFAAPVWWGLVAYVLGRWREVGVGLLGVHLGAVGLLLWLGSPLEPGAEQWGYLGRAVREAPVLVWGGVGVYLAGLGVALRGCLPSGNAGS